VYFVKQLDFMLLGMDPFVNTFNFIRCSRDIKTLGSFQIIMLVCDQGQQGPQSSFDSYGDFCSIARIPCYSLTNAVDAADILDTQLAVPGFRMFALSSRHCKTEFLQLQKVYRNDDCSVFQYTEGKDATIVGFNFSLQEGHQLLQKMQAQGMSASLFSASYVPAPDWSRIIASVAQTRRLVVLDDSKSVHLPCYKLIDAIHQSGVTFRRDVVTRQEIDFGMSDDKFPVDYDALLASLKAR
jgi:pyruvate/2-oxoglutarate/acetoin dehydrogenase E1 component